VKLSLTHRGREADNRGGTGVKKNSKVVPSKHRSFGVGLPPTARPFVSHSHSQSWRERQKMLKSCVRPLITLVLVLVATGALSTLSHARSSGGPEGTQMLRATDSSPRPVTTSGEPDSPSAPPPVRLNGGVTAPGAPTASSTDDAVGYWIILRWTGWVWAYWYARVPL
jgi:hypothetical protein